MVTHTVYHRELEIELNLTREDWGHPERPGLIDELYLNYQADRLVCWEFHERDGWVCPGFMTIKKRRGRYYAAHVGISEAKETASESDLHKALKGYTADTADRLGFKAAVEDRARHGRRRTDVTVTGTAGRKLGYEIQLSAISPGSVDRRTKIARDDGLVPLWLVTNEHAMPIDRAPWIRLNAYGWTRSHREALPVRGGVKTLKMIKCRRLGTKCPVQGYGSCDERHGVWNATTGLFYDDVIYKTAAGELVTLYQPSHKPGRRGWHMWVTPGDKERFLDGRPEPAPDDVPRGRSTDDDDERPVVPRERDPRCHYGEDSGYRDEMRKPRDSGEPVAAHEWMTGPPASPASMSINGYEVPGDLIRLRRDFDLACAYERKFWTNAPTASQTLAGATLDDARLTELADVRAEQLRLAVALNRHPWLASARNRAEAGFAVAEAALRA